MLPVSLAMAYVPIGAKTLPYGPDTCISGYVWREATPQDHICVVPEERTQARHDNAGLPNSLCRDPPRADFDAIWQ